MVYLPQAAIVHISNETLRSAGTIATTGRALVGCDPVDRRSFGQSVCRSRKSSRRLPGCLHEHYGRVAA